MAAPLFKFLWIGRCGFGFVWRGTEHQFYRDCDGSMGKPWTHHSFPWEDEARNQSAPKLGGMG